MFFEEHAKMLADFARVSGRRAHAPTMCRAAAGTRLLSSPVG